MILIAPDKFKGTFTAKEICVMVERRLREKGVEREIVGIAMSDGGEGAGEIFMRGGKQIGIGRYLSEDGGSVMIVSSEIVGIKNFEQKNIPLMNRSSYQLGKALVSGMKNYVAVGGTGVSDAGAGFLQALGARFYDVNGVEIREALCPRNMRKIASADFSGLKKIEIEGIIDVKAGLTEGSLTALDFARQKAIEGEDLSGLKESLNHFQKILGGKSVWDGAGGGLGYALASVLGVKCMSGGERAIENISKEISRAQLIITGEGCVDRQTREGGKIVDKIYREAVRNNVPVIILCGKYEAEGLYPNLFSINDNKESWVEKAIEILGRGNKI